ncbi:hypothetical protein J2797_006737 [Paraburkholderia terricola]|nr:hypothetical protein [Paraburkholderia terricola]
MHIPGDGIAWLGTIEGKCCGLVDTYVYSEIPVWLADMVSHCLLLSPGEANESPFATSVQDVYFTVWRRRTNT